MNPIAEDILMHYGVGHDDGGHSGRYPWGSGKDPYQHSGDFLSRIETLKKQGKTEKEIADEVGLSIAHLRTQVQAAKHERRAAEVARAKTLRDSGKSLNEIARIMGYKNDSSVRALLDDNVADRKNKAMATADALEKELAKKGMIDVGAGTERELNISAGKLDEALYLLEMRGYHVYGMGIPQVTNKGQQSNTKVLCGPDVEYRDVYQKMGDIQSVTNYYSTDGGKSYWEREYPASIDSDRVKIRYGDEGGTAKDGVIELRRGVEDLNLGNSHYAQVRILVDGSHYLKGMAMYSDNMPDGYDIVFNTNKKSGTDKMDVLKPIKDDPDNPFGALIKANGQSHYTDADGNDRLSAINKLKEEGEWDTMSRNLSSQFLSKQPLPLMEKQLKLTYSDSLAEFDEIASLTNPTVKKKMLMDFADECDGATVHLKAAALPRQSTRVILPVTDLKDTEIYAPTYNNGEQVALIRYPHAGTFEIPVLTVNNKQPSAKSILGNATDAVGINPKVAERLSGADFDGDTVVVIPTSDRVRVKSTPALKGLEGFDPKSEYSTEGKTGVRLMTKAQTQKEMGKVSNLITDMTLKGASEDDIVCAVKHSMVVIDAEKHKLDYKQSETDNHIKALQKKYQTRIDEDGEERVGGASTLISKKKQDIRVPERRGSGRPDEETGEMIYKTTGRTYTDKKGNIVEATTTSKLMLETPDARSLSSGTPQENLYADYANQMKALANRARKEAMATPRLERSSSARETYKQEVSSLNAKLNLAEKNAPKERRAQAIANATVKAKMQDNPNMDKKEEKKMRQLAINTARASVGASGKDSRIKFTDREWEAVQSGAISDTHLSKILRYADSKEVRMRATPRATTQLSSAKVSKIKAMSSSGYSIAEIAESMNCSSSTVSKYLNE